MWVKGFGVGCKSSLAKAILRILQRNPKGFESYVGERIRTLASIKLLPLKGSPFDRSGTPTYTKNKNYLPIKMFVIFV
jgi:hypothetical protein